MQTLYINEYIDVTGYGASYPVIVKADDDSTYVLKTRYQSNLNLDENEHARRLFDCSIYIETVSYLLLQTFGFEHIAEIVYLNIDDDAIADAEHRFNDLDNKREQMALENIQNSKGLNLDDLYAPDAMLRMSSWYDKYIFDIHYLLFDEIESVTKYRKKFSKDELLEILNTLPEVWAPNRIKEKIATILVEGIGNRRIFEDA